MGGADAGRMKDEHGKVCPANWREGGKRIRGDPLAKPDWRMERSARVSTSTSQHVHMSVGPDVGRRLRTDAQVTKTYCPLI